jgi:hypothetical protein
MSDDIGRTQEEEDRRRKEWALGDYTAEDCENCGRQRVCRCDNGKRRCEKCNWCPEEKRYVDDYGY